jgi:tripartite-type tricarboxylate transporter receptor subunit TctC
MAKVNIVQVPYKGGAESVMATASGQIDMNFPNIMSALPFVESGKLKPIAVTSAKRASLLPSIPTVGEAGLAGYDCSGWWALLAPAGIGKDIIDKLHTAVVKGINSADMKETLSRQGFEPQTSTQEQLAARIRAEIAQNARLIELAGLKPE